MLTSGDTELKELVDLYFGEINDIINDNDLLKFTSRIEEICSTIRIGQEQLKGKCYECPSWLDYFG